MKTSPMAVEQQDEFPLEPALDFMQHLWHLNHALERLSMQMEKQLGVTAQQRLFIRCIGRYPGMSATQLAGVLHLDRGTVSVSLRRLMSKGLVAGKRDKADARRVSLMLTSKGRKLDRPDTRTVEDAVNQLLESMGPAKLATTRASLVALAEAVMARLAG